MVCVTVAVVLGVGAVPVNATGTFLDAGTWAPPVEMLLVGAAHPPRIGRPIWEANRDKHTNIVFSLEVTEHSGFSLNAKEREKSQSKVLVLTERQVWWRQLSCVSEAVQTPSLYKWVIVKSLAVWGFCHINVIYIGSQQLRSECNLFGRHVLHSWMVSACETGGLVWSRTAPVGS